MTPEQDREAFESHIAGRYSIARRADGYSDSMTDTLFKTWIASKDAQLAAMFGVPVAYINDDGRVVTKQNNHGGGYIADCYPVPESWTALVPMPKKDGK